MVHNSTLSAYFVSSSLGKKPNQKKEKKNLQSGISEQSRGRWSVKPIYSKVDKDKVPG